MTSRALIVLVVCTSACTASSATAFGQEAPKASCAAPAGDPSTCDPATDGKNGGAAKAEEPGTGGSAVGRFVRDVGGDYKHYFSSETVLWYAGGLTAAGLVHLGDEDIAEGLGNETWATRALEGGDDYGNLSMQLPLAVGWWAIGHAVGSARGADAGRDLLRAQISAASWAYAWKFAVDRTRPNGDPRSFPSGHAAATFATAMVLQEHYGWKVGLPFFGAAAYTAISRLTINKHWASDVTFGAFIGMTSARTVTIHLRHKRFALAPLSVPGGGGVALVAVN